MARRTVNNCLFTVISILLILCLLALPSYAVDIFMSSSSSTVLTQANYPTCIISNPCRFGAPSLLTLTQQATFQVAGGNYAGSLEVSSSSDLSFTITDYALDGQLGGDFPISVELANAKELKFNKWRSDSTSVFVDSAGTIAIENSDIKTNTLPFLTVNNSIAEFRLVTTTWKSLDVNTTLVQFEATPTNVFLEDFDSISPSTILRTSQPSIHISQTLDLKRVRSTDARSPSFFIGASEVQISDSHFSNYSTSPFIILGAESVSIVQSTFTANGTLANETEVDLGPESSNYFFSGDVGTPLLFLADQSGLSPLSEIIVSESTFQKTPLGFDALPIHTNSTKIQNNTFINTVGSFLSKGLLDISQNQIYRSDYSHSILNVSAIYAKLTENQWFDSNPLGGCDLLWSPTSYDSEVPIANTMFGNISVGYFCLARHENSYIFANGTLEAKEQLRFDSPDDDDDVDITLLNQGKIRMYTGGNISFVNVTSTGDFELVINSTTPLLVTGTNDLSLKYFLRINGALTPLFTPDMNVTVGSNWTLIEGNVLVDSMVQPRADTILNDPQYAFKGTLSFENSAIKYTITNVSCTCVNNAPCKTERFACDCSPLWGGPACECFFGGIPEDVVCDPAGGKAWIIERSWDVEPNTTLVVPEDHTFKVVGDCSNFGKIDLLPGSSLVMDGFFRNAGQVTIKSSLRTVFENGQCVIEQNAFISSNFVSFDSNSTIELNYDASAIGSAASCTPVTAASAFKRNGAGTPTALSSSGNSELDGEWNVVVTGDSNTRGRINLVESSDKGSSTISSTITLTASTPKDTCSSFDRTPGTLSLIVTRCKNQRKWYYWGIPIIVVGVLLIVAIIVILSVPKISEKILPYRGTRMM